MSREYKISADAVSAQLSRLQIGVLADDLNPKPSASLPSTITAPTITVTELPTPPFSPPADTTTFDASLRPSSAGGDTAPIPAPDSNPFTPGTFPYFPLLPAELRLKVWALSLAPRTVELHTRRTHYADSVRGGGVPQWQSLSRNPALLAVSAEARAAALEFYTVALPLAAPFGRQGYRAFERPGDMLNDSDRVLYISLEADTVVVLGDLHYGRLTKLLEWFRAQDTGRGRAGKGVRRLAMGVAQWAHEVGARTLKAFARSVFADMEEFVLFMYKERMPPEEWTGGRCVLEEACSDDDYYRRFVIGKGKQFREGDGWMVVGKRAMKVVDLQFVDGW